MSFFSYETLNVLQLGLAFFCIFFAFNSQGFVEEPVISSASTRGGIDQHAGYYSLAIIYGLFMIGNFLAAPMVSIISPKKSMVLAASFYALFQAGFLFVNEEYLYISSALLGFSASLLWTGQGTYLAQNCTKETTSRNSALTWAMSESSLMFGGVFLFVVFHQNKHSNNIPDVTIKILYAVFTVLTVVGMLILCLLRAPPKSPEMETKLEYIPLLASTFKLMCTKKMLFLAFVFGFTGIQQSFWTGVYPTCISNTLRLGANTNEMLALNAICAGFGQFITAGFVSFKGKALGRTSIALTGAIINLLVFIGLYVNMPRDWPLHQTMESGGLFDPKLWIVLVCGFLLTVADACWNTQVYSILIDTFPEQSSQAFSIFKFYQSAHSCAAFFYGSWLQLQWQLIILAIYTLLSAACFFIVERINRLENRRRIIDSTTDFITNTKPLSKTKM